MVAGQHAYAGTSGQVPDSERVIEAACQKSVALDPRVGGEMGVAGLVCARTDAHTRPHKHADARTDSHIHTGPLAESEKSEVGGPVQRTAPSC